MAKGNVTAFWSNERRREALARLMDEYALRAVEVVYVRASVCGAATSAGLPPSIRELLDQLVATVSTFFQNGCTDPHEVTRFEATLEDQATIDELDRRWAIVRSEKLAEMNLLLSVEDTHTATAEQATN